MSFPGDCGKRINKDNIEYPTFMHLQGGKLYGINTTGQVLCFILVVLKGLNPSLANPVLCYVNWQQSQYD